MSAAAPTRTRLVEAARHLFWERGYGAASMADILARAGANSGSFYHFFDGKESLLREVLETYLEGLEPAIIAPARRAAADPIDRIFAILAGYRVRLIATHCTYGCPLGRLALEVDPENRPAHERIAANFAAWRGAVRTLLDDAGDRLPRNLDRDGLATLVLATMEGGVMQSRASGTPEPFDRAVAQLRDYFVRLGAPPSRAPSTRAARMSRVSRTSVARHPSSRKSPRPHRRSTP